MFENRILRKILGRKDRVGDRRLENYIMRNFIICILHQIDEWTSSTHWENETFIQNIDRKT
jgi:hypothetical protein